jgi:hypothetical protein
MPSLTEPKSVTRYLAKLGEPIEVPGRSPTILEEHGAAPKGLRKLQLGARRAQPISAAW